MRMRLVLTSIKIESGHKEDARCSFATVCWTYLRYFRYYLYTSILYSKSLFDLFLSSSFHNVQTAKSNDIPEMNLIPTDHLYSPILVTRKNTRQKWTGYLYSSDKIWIMSVGWMYCYAALDAQRILSALQDMCIAYQDGCWFLFWWHTQMHWQHLNQTKRNNNIRVGNILYKNYGPTSALELQGWC